MCELSGVGEDLLMFLNPFTSTFMFLNNQQTNLILISFTQRPVFSYPLWSSCMYQDTLGYLVVWTLGPKYVRAKNFISGGMRR